MCGKIRREGGGAAQRSELQRRPKDLIPSEDITYEVDSTAGRRGS